MRQLKKLQVILIIILQLKICHAQLNLVPNPSFELHDSCPDDYSQIEKAIGWTDYYGTPDYFNKCSPTILASIPNNARGVQESNSFVDSGYCGIVINTIQDYMRESFCCYLLDTLEIGHRYYFSLLYSPQQVDTPPQEFTHCFSSHLGFKLFSYDIMSVFPRPDLTDNSAIGFASTIDKNLNRWEEFKTSFIADSQYTLLVIGYFFDINHINIFCENVSFPNSNRRTAGLYIDRICLTKDSFPCFVDETVQPVSTKPFVVINNFNEHLLLFTFNEYFISRELRIYSYLGQLVYSSTVEASLPVNYSNWVKGFYICNIGNSSIKFL